MDRIFYAAACTVGANAEAQVSARCARELQKAARRDKLTILPMRLLSLLFCEAS